MGWEARLNPRSHSSGRSEREQLEARVQRFCEFFQSREEFEGYLEGRNITSAEKAYLESHLPPRLQPSRIVMES